LRNESFASNNTSNAQQIRRTRTEAERRATGAKSSENVKAQIKIALSKRLWPRRTLAAEQPAPGEEFVACGAHADDLQRAWLRVLVALGQSKYQDTFVSRKFMISTFGGSAADRRAAPEVDGCCCCRSSFRGGCCRSSAGTRGCGAHDDGLSCECHRDETWITFHGLYYS